MADIENPELERSKQWFKQAKFGMFVHWGLYSIPAGTWNKHYYPKPLLGEWIMHDARIPIRDYERLADSFNPRKFNAFDWVRRAEDSGMKYLVFTTKHHDGFAMFNSKADHFNVVESTPWKRDPVQELAQACQGTKVKLGLYYSHVMDWHEPASGNFGPNSDYGNTWDHVSTGTREDFENYFQRKALPQVRELLTQYGPIAMMWFDNPIYPLTKNNAQELKDLVRLIQPGCLISSRIFREKGFADVQGYGDNQVPTSQIQGLGEACVTTNDTWGYKEHDHNWQSAKDLRLLRDHTNKMGCNFLLNVGPKPDGSFPKKARRILRRI